MRPRKPSPHLDNTTSLELYTTAANAAAAQIIGHYSTSFGLGTRLLGPAMRTHIEAVYAMVRIADEIVDTYRAEGAREMLDAFEQEIGDATARGYSPNVVAHAFGMTARAVGITDAQTAPYFASMRMDLDTVTHDRASFETDVYGSAGVVGEMCLAVFLNTPTGPRPLPEHTAAGARALGDAYQKINFLRDIAMDDGQLGRSYFPGVTAKNLDDATLATLVADCRSDIATAQQCLPALPRRARIAVETTMDIYARLLSEIAATPAAELAQRRVRVGNMTKFALAARNSLPWLPSRRRPV